MPELPEVEWARRQAEHWLFDQRLEDVWAQAGAVRGIVPRRLRALRGERVGLARRIGKHLLLELSGGQTLHLHFGMTGKLVCQPPGALPVPRSSWLRLTTSKGDVHFCDTRRFGRIELVAGDGLDAADIARLGPDAWTALPVARVLHARLSQRRGPIKVQLLDQSLLAGLGNIYAAEALWHARVSPRRAANTLSLEETRRLRAGIQATLRLGLKSLPKSPAQVLTYVEEGGHNPFRVYGREGQPCRSDRTPIARIVQAQRSTFFCPTCQR